MTEYKVTFNFECPEEGATPKDVEAWVQFCLGWRADIKINNPLCGYDLCNVIAIDVS